MNNAVILENIREIRKRIASAAERSGREASQIALVAVTKYASTEAIKRLIGTGEIRSIGESRIQDAHSKKALLGAEFPGLEWRMIGHIQRNKAKKALDVFDTVDSLDSLELARTLDQLLSERGIFLPVLAQVKLSEKETQGGVPPENPEEFLNGLKPFPRLKPRGLMAIAPMVEPVEAVRPYFRRMKQLLDRFFPPDSMGDEEAILSMGMSRDYELAVEEGSTMLRLGTALFATAKEDGKE